MTADLAQNHFSVAGPYRSNGRNKLPSLDWNIHVATGAQAIDGEIISTGDNAFIKYGGRTYEAGRAAMAQVQAAAAKRDSSLKNVDIARLTRQMGDWFPRTSVQHDAQLDGEAVTRVTGRLDASKALEDITQLGESGPVATRGEIDQLNRQVTDPRFTVDVGKSDGKLRRILATLRIRGRGGLRFEIRYRNVDQPVTINAPSSGLPLSQLEKKFERQFGGSSGSGSTA